MAEGGSGVFLLEVVLSSIPSLLSFLLTSPLLPLMASVLHVSQFWVVFPRCWTDLKAWSFSRKAAHKLLRTSSSVFAFSLQLPSISDLRSMCNPILIWYWEKPHLLLLLSLNGKGLCSLLV